MKNILIVLLLITVIVLGYLQFKPKTTNVTISPTEMTPTGQTQVRTNPNGPDYQPQQNSTAQTNTSDTLANGKKAEATIEKYMNQNYIGSLSWPPTFQSSSTAYACTPGSTGGEVPQDTVQKKINGRTYCIISFVDGGAGHWAGEYTYKVANGSGTKTTSFRIDWPNCGGYGGPGDPNYDACEQSHAAVFGNLDVAIDYLLWK